jgi:hypothetical protein
VLEPRFQFSCQGRRATRDLLIVTCQPEICDYCEVGVLENGECRHCEELYERQMAAAYEARILRWVESERLPLKTLTPSLEGRPEAA